MSKEWTKNWTIGERAAVGVQLTLAFPQTSGIETESDALVAMLRERGDEKAKKLVALCQEAAHLYIEIMQEEQPGSLDGAREFVRENGDEYP